MFSAQEQSNNGEVPLTSRVPKQVKKIIDRKLLMYALLRERTCSKQVASYLNQSSSEARNTNKKLKLRVNNLHLILTIGRCSCHLSSSDSIPMCCGILVTEPYSILVVRHHTHQYSKPTNVVMGDKFFQNRKRFNCLFYHKVGQHSYIILQL